MTIRRLLGCLSAVLLLAVFVSGAFAEPPLAGTYRAEGETAGGMAYGGQVGIEPDGKGVRLAWILDGGDSYRGVGLQIDNVLGSAYWSEDERFNGPGIVVYRIDGGKLRGTWLAYGGPEDWLVARSCRAPPAWRADSRSPSAKTRVAGRPIMAMSISSAAATPSSSTGTRRAIPTSGTVFASATSWWSAMRMDGRPAPLPTASATEVWMAFGRMAAMRAWGERPCAVNRTPARPIGRRLGLSGDRRHAMVAEHEQFLAERRQHARRRKREAPLIA